MILSAADIGLLTIEQTSVHLSHDHVLGGVQAQLARHQPVQPLDLRDIGLLAFEQALVIGG